MSNNLQRYDRMTGVYVIRNPYYYFDGLIPYLIPHPLHYILFSQFALYRWFVGGVWAHYQNAIWVRMEDRRKDEFCHEHLTMEPCKYCRAESDMEDTVWEERNLSDVSKKGGFDLNGPGVRSDA